MQRKNNYNKKFKNIRTGANPSSLMCKVHFFHIYFFLFPNIISPSIGITEYGGLTYVYIHYIQHVVEFYFIHKTHHVNAKLDI